MAYDKDEALTFHRREQLIWESNRSPTEKLILLALNQFVDCLGQCYPGCETIAKMTGFSARSVQRVIRGLEASGIIHTQNRKRESGNGQKSNLYAIKFALLATTEDHPPGDRGSPPLVTEDHPPGDRGSPDLSIRTIHIDLSNDPLRSPDRSGGEASENPLRSTEPEPDPEPPALDPASPLFSGVDLPVRRSPGAVTANVPPPPPAEKPTFDPFARRGIPQVIAVRAQFQGPWGEGYTPELEAFEAWLATTKAHGKRDPAAWIAAVVDGIGKGGSRALWQEFLGQGAAPDSTASDTADPVRAIAIELRRLNRPGLLPPEWQRRTGRQMVSQLSGADAQAYLAELRSQGVAA
jgi:hypothetical protein